MEHVDKNTLENYENPARLGESPSIDAEPGAAEEAPAEVRPIPEKKYRRESVLPGVITVCAVFVVLGAYAVIAPKFRKED